MKRPDETLRKLLAHARNPLATADVRALAAWVEQLEAENAALREERDKYKRTTNALLNFLVWVDRKLGKIF